MESVYFAIEQNTNLSGMKKNLTILFYLLLLFPAIASAKGLVIKGKVVDTDSRPLIGVTVVESTRGAKQNATVTDVSYKSS